MDPMDYAFNHPSSSEAPFHIATSSVSPPWATYGSGPDVGSSLDPFYLPPTPALSTPFTQDHPTYIHTYQNHLTQTGTFTWGPGFIQSSPPQGYALPRTNYLPDQGARSRDQNITRIHDSQPWNDISARQQLPRLDPQDGSVPSLPNSVQPPVETETCSTNQETLTSHGESVGLSPNLPDDGSVLLADRLSGRGQRWQSLNDDDNALRGPLPPLRNQPPLHSSDGMSGSTLPSLHSTSTNSSSSRLRPQRPNHIPQTRHSLPGTGEILTRLDESSSSFTRAGRQSPTSRPHRSFRPHAADSQRPISVSFDLGSTSRLPATAPSVSSASGITSFSPRRQRPSRTGPRRHMAAPRSPPHSYGRHPIDRSLVQEFLSSQNIGPSDWISNYPYPMIEEIIFRNLQSLQGTMGPARVARKGVINSLPPVPVEELEEDEKACTICYGLFGEESPEGTTEEAVRLPDCKHVFGSLCLKTWLEDSDKCPYCRKKLPSEPKWFFPAAKRVLAMIKRPQSAGSDPADNETCLAVVRGYSRGGWLQSPPPPSHTVRIPLSTSSRALNEETPLRRALNTNHETSMPRSESATQPTSPQSEWRLSSSGGMEYVQIVHFER